jgi:hypothetical protein
MITQNFNQLHSTASAYEAPSILMVDISPEGVLCESGVQEERDIDNFVVLPETDW